MKIEENGKRRFGIELVMVCLMIAIGMAMIVQAFSRYGQAFIEIQDEQLFHLAQAVDRNIASLLDRYYTNLTYVTERRGFEEAEENWRQTGETGDLLFRMEENILSRSEMIAAMIAVQDGKVFLSTDNRLDYTLPVETKNKELIPCIRGDGEIFLTLMYEVEDGLSYGALIDLDKFYSQIVGDELAQYDWVILTDAASEILMFQQQGELKVDQIDAVSGATCGQEGVNILLSRQENQSLGTDSYEYQDGTSDKSYTARMVTLPTNETINKALAVGVVTNFETVMETLKAASFQLLGYGGLVAVGVLLLIRLAVRFRKRNEEGMRELQLLREKNEATEAILQKTRELAHHQRLETIGTLTSGIAHEFNNLLTPIMGYSILTLEELPPEQEELYDNVLEIYNASCKARDIVARLSQLPRKKTAAESFDKLSLDDLVKKVLRVAIPAKPAGIEIEMELHLKANYILANETQISQMLINLVLNGFHAMEEKGGILTVSTEKEGDMAVLFVKDTGTGIKEEVLEHIYEPFFTTKEAGKGTGLGLAIVQQVVSEHGGKISVSTKEGEGTIFKIELPLMSPPEESK